MKALIDYICDLDRRLVLIVATLALCAVMAFYGLFRLGAWLTYKSIEGHIEKKVSMMMSAEAFRK